MKNTVTQPRVLAKVPSKSNPAKSYEIRLGGDGVVYCTCRAWVTNKFCKHLEEYHSRNMTPAYPTTPNINPNAVVEFFEAQANQGTGDANTDKIYLTVKNGIIGGKW